MNILNISSIIPLKGLKRENDIILRIQDYLKDNYGYDFTIAMSLPYVPFILSLINDKWKKYRDYQHKRQLKVQGHDTVIYPWLLPPTSNFWLNYFLIPVNWVWYIFVVQKKIFQEAKNADLLLTQNLIPDAILAYWLHKKYDTPYIINIRGKSEKYWYKLPVLRSVIKNASQVITHSPTNYQLFKDDYEIELVPHPVDDIFYFDGNNEYSYPKLISVCRLLSLKNIDKVIYALSKLKKQGQNFEYCIVGDGPRMKSLKELVIELGLVNEVSFEGYLSREKVAAQLKDSNVFIMPSNPETLGRAFLEAAASGCLIIGHQNTGVDGLFTHQESAIFVNEDTVYKGLKTVFENLNTMSNYREKSQKIVKNLKWDKIGSIYDDIFTKSYNQ
ncbi:glycosyltransferase family 4 protein [Fodinibius sp. SL11]|uniref:glycosyltransferase family 4 protein n=1 Tax=Fodinibius sp. SL11 TaxID=3425690 RepID=UPI003F884D36